MSAGMLIYVEPHAEQKLSASNKFAKSTRSMRLAASVTLNRHLHANSAVTILVISRVSS